MRKGPDYIQIYPPTFYLLASKKGGLFNERICFCALLIGVCYTITATDTDGYGNSIPYVLISALKGLGSASSMTIVILLVRSWVTIIDSGKAQIEPRWHQIAPKVDPRHDQKMITFWMASRSIFDLFWPLGSQDAGPEITFDNFKFSRPRGPQDPPKECTRATKTPARHLQEASRD